MILSAVNAGGYLVKNIIETLIQIFQVQEDHSPANLHTNLYLVDISTDLKHNVGRNGVGDDRGEKTHLLLHNLYKPQTYIHMTIKSAPSLC